MNDRTMHSALRAAGVLVLLGVCTIDAPALHAQTKAAAVPVRWTKVSIELPVGDVLFPAGDGAQLANGYCLMCHSSGMVLRQPPLTESDWLAEIQKMRTFWGAPIPVDQDAALARYLTHINGPTTGR